MPEVATTRDLDDQDVVLDEVGLLATYGQSWAVVIGIDDYEHCRKLTHAVADAAAVAEVLITRFRFPPENVFLVLDGEREGLAQELAAWLDRVRPSLAGHHEHATLEVLRELLSTTLPSKAVGENDRVLVYFAGHGKSRIPPGSKAREGRPYLVPADAEPEKWHTYLDLRLLLQDEEYLAAKHVFYIFDACCSGLAGLRAEATPTRFERRLLQRRARQCLTAGTGEEYVADAGYEGHSVFTWHLLDALRNTASRNEGALSATALIDEVKQSVGRDARSKQVPDGFPIAGHRGGEFIFTATRAPLTLDERARLASLLVHEVDQHLDEPSAVELGARLWAWLAAVPMERAVVALREQARALLVLGRTEAAGRLLTDAALEDDPEAMLLRGLVLLRSKAAAAARDELAALAERHPKHPCAGWARLTAEALERPRGRRVALLVGVDVTAKQEITQGCVEDVKALARLLSEKLGFETQLLTDEQATRAAVLGSLGQLAADMKPEDSFVFFFTGTGMREQTDVVRYVCYDMDREQLETTMLPEVELDRAVRANPARDKLWITDGCHLGPPADAGSGYRFLSGCGRGQMAFETLRANGVHRGAFSYALETALERDPSASMASVLASVRADLTEQGFFERQTPQYVGDPLHPLISEGMIESELIDLVEGHQPSRFALATIECCGRWLQQQPGVSAVPVRLAVGRALLARSRYPEAIAVLDDEFVSDPEAHLLRVQAALLDGRVAEALERWKQYVQRVEACGRPRPPQLAEVQATLEQLPKGRGAALVVVVGTSGTPDRDVPTWTTKDGSEPLARAARAALSRRCGFTEESVEILANPGRDAIVAAFDRLLIHAGDGPAFFLFVGPGEVGTALYSADADHEKRDLHLKELVDRAAGHCNLVNAIFIHQESLRRQHAGRDWFRELGTEAVIGVPSMQREISPTKPPTKPPPAPELLRVLEQHGHPLLSGQAWLARAGRPPGTYVVGNASAPLFAHPELANAIEQVKSLARAPLGEALELLAQLAEEAEYSADAWLHVGVLRAALGRRRDALDDIDRAIARHREEHPVGDEAHEGSDPVAWPEAHYHRGRILLAEGRYPEAERALALAVQQDGGNARAHYHRIRAIRGIIESDLQQQVQATMLRYQELGAPLGLDEDLTRFATTLARTQLSSTTE